MSGWRERDRRTHVKLDVLAAERAAADGVGLVFALLTTHTEREVVDNPERGGALAGEPVLCKGERESSWVVERGGRSVHSR